MNLIQISSNLFLLKKNQVNCDSLISSTNMNRANLQGGKID